MKTICFILLSSRLLSCIASDLRIGQTEWYRDEVTKKLHIKLNIAWNNSWHNAKNHDGVWLFFKYLPYPYGENDNYVHAKVKTGGHKLIHNHIENSPGPDFEVSIDKVGLFIYPKSQYRGHLNWSILVEMEDVKEDLIRRSIGIYGIEMVLIPEGKFTIGDADTSAIKSNFTFYKSDKNGKYDGLYTIENESTPIPVGAGNGSLYYHVETAAYQGDQKGSIPTEFPKGFNAFWIMKYELTQGAYAEFLNSISNSATYQRANFGGRDYVEARGSIQLINKKFIAHSPLRPANFISWDDAMAYADWAGLRPYTELEYEKACRGPLSPIAREYSWNTASKEKLIRYIDKHDELTLLDGYTESDLTDQNRELFGASYYWVMDLSGSVWERVVTIGDSTGRAFKGSHGDGILSYGFATLDDWPKGSTETSGFGFRGGGYYRHDQLYGLNPNVTIANRIFSAWSGGMRSKAYGSRFVRSRN